MPVPSVRSAVLRECPLRVIRGERRPARLPRAAALALAAAPRPARPVPHGGVRGPRAHVNGPDRGPRYVNGPDCGPRDMNGPNCGLVSILCLPCFLCD